MLVARSEKPSSGFAASIFSEIEMRRSWPGESRMASPPGRSPALVRALTTALRSSAILFSSTARAAM